MSRELDARVAVEVMVMEIVEGVRVIWECGSSLDIGIRGDYSRLGDQRLYEPVPMYSACISDAWLVVEKLREMGWTVIVNASGDEDFYFCRVFKTVPYEDERTKGKGLRVLDKASRLMETGETAPEAICLAALAAVA